MENINDIKYREDIIKMEEIIHRVGGYPSPETRRNIVTIINKILENKVIDITTPEDIDSGKFRYVIETEKFTDEIFVNFQY